MKRILLSLVVIGLISVAAIGATRAYFFDTETSTSNVLTAGTLDLKVDDKEGTQVVHLSRSNLVPGPAWTTQYGGQWVIKNAGSVPGTVTVTIKNLKDWENGCNDPETKAGDTTCGTGSDQGELGKGLINRVYWTLNQVPWGTVGPTFSSLANAVNVPVTGSLYHLNAGESKNAYLYLTWDTSATDNLGQGDSVEFDVEFRLDQDHP